MEKPPFQFGLKTAFVSTMGAGILAAVFSADAEMDKAVAAAAILISFGSLVVFVFVLPPHA